MINFIKILLQFGSFKINFMKIQLSFIILTLSRPQSKWGDLPDRSAVFRKFLEIQIFYVTFVTLNFCKFPNISNSVSYVIRNVFFNLKK